LLKTARILTFLAQKGIFILFDSFQKVHGL